MLSLFSYWRVHFITTRFGYEARYTQSGGRRSLIISCRGWTHHRGRRGGLLAGDCATKCGDCENSINTFAQWQIAHQTIDGRGVACDVYSQKRANNVERRWNAQDERNQAMHKLKDGK